MSPTTGLMQNAENTALHAQPFAADLPRVLDLHGDASGVRGAAWLWS